MAQILPGATTTTVPSVRSLIMQQRPRQCGGRAAHVNENEDSRWLLCRKGSREQ
eukprot:COSAG01_NODE_3025_length_6708_cov_3.364352_1_plen_54_part_00